MKVDIKRIRQEVPQLLQNNIQKRPRRSRRTKLAGVLGKPAVRTVLLKFAGRVTRNLPAGQKGLVIAVLAFDLETFIATTLP